MHTLCNKRSIERIANQFTNLLVITRPSSFRKVKGHLQVTVVHPSELCLFSPLIVISTVSSSIVIPTSTAHGPDSNLPLVIEHVFMPPKLLQEALGEDIE